jgi:hypothetical protein
MDLDIGSLGVIKLRYIARCLTNIYFVRKQLLASDFALWCCSGGGALRCSAKGVTSTPNCFKGYRLRSFMDVSADAANHSESNSGAGWAIAMLVVASLLLIVRCARL